MKLYMTAIKDRAVDAFHPITCVRAEGEAIRGFIDALNNPANKTFAAHPDDFDMYVLGTFDDNSGEIIAETPRKIADGKQLMMQGD